MMYFPFGIDWQCLSAASAAVSIVSSAFSYSDRILSRTSTSAMSRKCAAAARSRANSRSAPLFP